MRFDELPVEDTDEVYYLDDEDLELLDEIDYLLNEEEDTE